MKACIILISLLAFSSSALAQKIKVRKVRGNQAVIEFSGGELNMGQVYEIAGDDFAEASPGTSRQNSINLSMNLVNAKSDRLSTTTTELSLQAGYGWNLGSIEAGPMFGYNSTNASGVTSTIYRAGGFGDFNLIPNTPGEIFLYGIGGKAFFGSVDNGTGSNATFTEFSAAPFVKWFPGGGGAGFRFEVGYFMQNQSGGTTGNVNNGNNTVSGLMSTVGIFSYF